MSGWSAQELGELGAIAGLALRCFVASDEQFLLVLAFLTDIFVEGHGEEILRIFFGIGSGSVGFGFNRPLSAAERPPTSPDFWDAPAARKRSKATRGRIPDLPAIGSLQYFLGDN